MFLAFNSVVYSYAYVYKIITTTIKTSDTVLRKIYLSLYWKGCVREGVGDRTKTATYWPPLLWPSAFLSCSPGLLNRRPGPQPLWVLAFSTASCLQTALSYIIFQRPPSSCGRHKLHSFNPSTIKATLCYSSTGCTCYLYRCISYFDSPAGS